MKNHLRDILISLADANIRFIVAGGVAAVLHGVERLTMDIDLCVDMSPDNLKKFLKIMGKLKLTPRVPVAPEDLMDPAKVRKMVDEKNAIVFTFMDVDFPLKQVDIFLKEDISYEKLCNDVNSVEVEGRHIRIVSRKKLIEMKKSVRPVRQKDLQDIRELSRLRGDSE